MSQMFVSPSIRFEFSYRSKDPLANPPVNSQIVLELVPKNLSLEVFADYCKKIMEGLKPEYRNGVSILNSTKCIFTVSQNFTKAQVPCFAEVVLQAARDLKTIDNIPLSQIVHDEVNPYLADLGINIPSPAPVPR